MTSSLASSIAHLPTDQREAILANLTPDEAEALRWDWRFWARENQLPPPGDWQFWLILAGRGFGKTRSGAEWIIDKARAHDKCRIALVAETSADARDVMVEGESGIIECSPPWFKPNYEPSKRRLTWPNGSQASTYSADEPDQLRGPQHHFAWGDEPAKWKYEDAYDQLCFGLRLGDAPQGVLTTTPRPTKLIKELVDESLVPNPSVVLTRGSTYDNRDNLAGSFLRKIISKYEGTRLGRQELNAEILDDAPGALWKRDNVDLDRVFSHPRLVRVVVAIDPSVSSESADAATGIVVAGRGDDGHGYLLADGSLERPTPDEWGRQAASLYNTHQANRIIAEVNNGGDLVEANLKSVQRNLPVTKIRASRGKDIRAEPIAALCEQHRIHHVGTFPLLEDELCQWEPGVSRFSPNRLDAYVWAFTELMLENSVFSPEIKTLKSGGSRWGASNSKGF